MLLNLPSPSPPPPPLPDFPPIEDGRLWVFAYGSLMERPGFDWVERRPALLRGYHRSCCILSTIYRGTAAAPGLVTGLERGGACRGLVFAVREDRAPDVVAYLREREMITSVYVEKAPPVLLDDGRRVRAFTFVADRSHPQYAGRLSRTEAVRLIRQGHGQAGSSRDYLADIVRHLDGLGIADGPLHRLLSAVDSGERPPDP